MLYCIKRCLIVFLEYIKCSSFVERNWSDPIWSIKNWKLSSFSLSSSLWILIKKALETTMFAHGIMPNNILQMKLFNFMFYTTLCTYKTDPLTTCVCWNMFSIFFIYWCLNNFTTNWYEQWDIDEQWQNLFFGT